MTEAAERAPVKVSLREQAEEAHRELTRRYRVGSARVKSGEMTAAEMAGSIDVMRAIRNTLRLLAEHEEAVRATLKREIERSRQREEIAALEQHPFVAAVRDEFPGAEITSTRKLETATS